MVFKKKHFYIYMASLVLTIVFGVTLFTRAEGTEISASPNDLRVCYQVGGNGGAQCGGFLSGCSGYASNPSYSPIYFDDTDDRFGYCTLRWELQGDAGPGKFRICRNYDGDGGNQCGNPGISCSGWNDAPGPTQDIIDDTDQRWGKCYIYYKIEEQSAEQNPYVYRLCYSTIPTGDGGQCGASPDTCTGWSNEPSWSPIQVDDTDNRAGGCNLSWKVERKKRFDTVLNNFNYSDPSLLIFTNTEGSFSNTNSGDTIRYRVTVSNPDWQAKSTKVKFFVPYGFRFVRMVNSAESTLRADGLQINAFGPGEIKWDYIAPPGETYITFDLQAI